MCAPFHDTLQGEVAQTVSKALLSQLNISPTGDTWERHHKGWTILTPPPWICPMSRRPGHGWWRRVGTWKIDLFSHEYCISIMVWLLNQGKVFCFLFTCQMQSIEISQIQKAIMLKDNILIPFPICLFFLTWTDYINIQRYYKPVRSTRSIGLCSALGVGLRAWRGERVLGVEAGEFGSTGSSGSG